MKDKFGREVTEHTKLEDLPPEVLNKLLGSMSLGQAWLLQATGAANNKQIPEGWSKWCERFSRFGMVVQPPSVTVGSTTYVQMGASIGLNEQATRNLLSAFGIGDVPELSVPVSQANLEKLGIPAQSAGCFIATAVFSPLAPEVTALRRWRDTTLTQQWSGRLFVTWYYCFGPSLAKFLTRWPVLVSMTRSVLRAFVRKLDRQSRTKFRAHDADSSREPVSKP
jgi:hypothetical protein